MVPIHYHGGELKRLTWSMAQVREPSLYFGVTLPGSTRSCSWGLKVKPFQKTSWYTPQIRGLRLPLKRVFITINFYTCDEFDWKQNSFVVFIWENVGKLLNCTKAHNSAITDFTLMHITEMTYLYNCRSILLFLC